MDDDDLRRGKPSCHKQFGEATALLAGDALLTLAFATALGGNGATCPSDRKLHAVKLLAERAGVMGMIGGQVIDLMNTGVTMTIGEMSPDQIFKDYARHIGIGRGHTGVALKSHSHKDKRGDDKRHKCHSAHWVCSHDGDGVGRHGSEQERDDRHDQQPDNCLPDVVHNSSEREESEHSQQRQHNAEHNG